jgi:hypothetical protein
MLISSARFMVATLGMFLSFFSFLFFFLLAHILALLRMLEQLVHLAEFFTIGLNLT